jgi:hypothetical protein
LTAFVVTIGIFNIILWIIFIIKFKKLFSTDDIISKTRSEMNNMIIDINRNTERDISLIDDRTQKLKLIIAEADRHIALARAEEEKHASVQELHTAMNRAPSVEKRAADTYKRVSGGVKPRQEFAYEVTDTGMHDVSGQNTLFNEDTRAQTKVTAHEDGTSFSEVPVNTQKVFFSESPVMPKVDFSRQVTDLAATGLTVEQIAKKLSCSLSEVQMVLDMNN